ncbi:hypothetical protein RAM_44725 [Amycolatopsis mediterranei S699]|nr:hypothetical protein RAM_44725 [Amycolatopsis mediterranei S699]
MPAGPVTGCVPPGTADGDVVVGPVEDVVTGVDDERALVVGTDELAAGAATGAASRSRTTSTTTAVSAQTVRLTMTATAANVREFMLPIAPP